MNFKVKKISGDPKWSEVLIFSNEKIELQIPLNIGPRVTSFCLAGKPNIFYEAPGARNHFGANEWFSYGGHRLWHAPEQNPRSYYPDNSPVQVVASEEFVDVVQNMEKTTGIQKKIRFHLGSDGSNIRLDHILTNQGLWPVEFAGWALSMLRKGGKAIIPLPDKIPFPEKLLPQFPLVVWPYTDLGEQRLHFAYDHVTITQIPGSDTSLKIGAACEKNWVGYLIEDMLFVKKFTYEQGGTYPDMGSSIAVYTDSEMLELETLSPLLMIDPGESLVHTEVWYLWDIDEIPAHEKEINKVIQNLITGS